MNNNKCKTKIFIFDDHSSVRESYKRWLELEGFQIVGMEGSFNKKSVQAVKKCKSDIILMDIDLEGEKEGFKASSEILNEIPDAKIIFVSHYNEPAIIKEAFQCGARGYFSKSDELEFLKEAMEKVNKGYAYLSPSAIKSLINHLKQNKCYPTQAGSKKSFNLSKQESLILNYLAQGLTNKEIASNLSTNEKRVKNIISNIFTKLEARNRAHAVFIGLVNSLIDVNS